MQQAPIPPRSVDWSSRVGRCVRLQGYAVSAKIGPELVGPDFAIGVIATGSRGEVAWDALPSGARVVVEGPVAVRDDLPVSVSEPSGLASQGVFVAPGGDVGEARRRYVIEASHFRLLRSIDEVEAALGASLNREVTLGGVMWSRNGHFWFNHDGVDLHVDGSGWGALHGKVVELRGLLRRRPMPRLDRLGLQAEPELAEAWVIEVQELVPHEVWTVESCHRP